MFWKNCHCHIIQECNIRRIQLKRYGMIIYYGNFLYIFIVWSILRAILRIHDRFNSKLYILCCKRFSIVPLYIFCKMERISTGLFIKVPALCQPWNYLVISVMGSQPVKNQDINFTMFIHCRINSGIISASIYQCFAAFFREYSCCRSECQHTCQH